MMMMMMRFMSIVGGVVQAVRLVIVNIAINDICAIAANFIDFAKVANDIYQMYESRMSIKLDRCVFSFHLTVRAKTPGFVVCFNLAGCYKPFCFYLIYRVVFYFHTFLCFVGLHEQKIES